MLPQKSPLEQLPQTLKAGIERRPLPLLQEHPGQNGWSCLVLDWMVGFFLVLVRLIAAHTGLQSHKTPRFIGILLYQVPMRN